jgi:FMN phosphatase YigB (HAD superfamily)
MKNRIYLFDWGDTLMVDTPGVAGKMCDWEHVEKVAFAKETLKRIHLKADIYIATAAAASTPQEIKKAFKRVGLSKYIKGYFCIQNTGFAKPDPEFYKVILKKLSISHHLLTMIGDNFEKDIIPCHKLGVKTVWLTTDQNKKIPDGIKRISTLRDLAP